MNKASFRKRLSAFIIDILIVSLVFSILTIFIKENNNIINLNKQLTELGETFVNKEITNSEFFNQYASIAYLLDKEMFLPNLLNFILMIGYFIVLPFYNNGQTTGKKLMKIKIVNNNSSITCNELILRNIIVNGFAYNLIAFSLIFLATDIIYFWVISILGFVQILLVIISAFMILYRKDKKGLQDIISNTQVVDEI